MAENMSVAWPGWDTVGLIGRGSFGEVYRIQRNVFGNVEQAALKVISIPQNAGDIEEMYSDGYDEASITSTFRSHLESIVAEYSLMRKMSGSANIVNCDDIRYIQHPDGIGWDIFIKMELLTPLTKALPPQIPEETVIKVAQDMGAALELCNKHGIIHRDIKPQNIFVSPNGDYKLGDFGIAKTVEKTMGGTKIGTYKYMAPEVYNNQPYGSGADIYSLGLVLYWMLNERRLPFLPLPPEKLLSGAEDAARHRRFSGEPLPPPAHGSPELKQIILKACAYDPSARYASAAEMLQALARVTNCAYATGNTAYGTGISGAVSQVSRNTAAPVVNTQDYSSPAVSAHNPQNIPYSTAYANQVPQSAGSAYYTPEANNYDKTPSQNKKSLGIIAAVVAALVVGCIFFLSRNGGGDKPSPSLDRPTIANTTPAANNQGSDNKQGATNPSTTPVPTTTKKPVNTAPALYNNTLNLDAVINAAPYYGAPGSYLIDDCGTVQYHQEALEIYGPSGIVVGAEGVSTTDGKDSVSILTSDGAIVTILGSKAVIVNVDAAGTIIGSNGKTLGHLKNGSVNLPIITSDAEWSLADKTTWQLKYFKESANIRTRPDGNAPKIDNLSTGTIAFYIHKEGYYALILTFVDRQPTLCWVRWASLTDKITKNCQLYNVVATDSLNVRDIPATEGKKVHSFPAGTIVEGYGHPGEWYYVRYPGGYGWCHEDYLERNVDAEKQAGLN